MNSPSRTEELEGTGMNQNPNALAADLTTREDMNGMANSRVLRRIASQDVEDERIKGPQDTERKKGSSTCKSEKLSMAESDGHVGGHCDRALALPSTDGGDSGGGNGDIKSSVIKTEFRRLCQVMMTFGKFVGPGFMVSDFKVCIIGEKTD